MITRHDVALRLTDYLHHRITLDDLVSWAEDVMMEEQLDERDEDVLREALGRLGLADVKAFGLTWEDCEGLLARLGYRVHVSITEA